MQQLIDTRNMQKRSTEKLIPAANNSNINGNSKQTNGITIKKSLKNNKKQVWIFTVNFRSDGLVIAKNIWFGFMTYQPL